MFVSKFLGFELKYDIEVDMDGTANDPSKLYELIDKELEYDDGDFNNVEEFKENNNGV